MKIFLHQEDLPEDLELPDRVAVDTETMGLHLHRDRLCVVQIGDGKENCHLVQIRQGQRSAPRLEAMLTAPDKVKLMHFARFDIASLSKHLGIYCRPVWCTRTASKLIRTFTERHGLRDLCRDLLGVEISKTQQTSDWGQAELTSEQQNYAATDVLYLHSLQDILIERLKRENRLEQAQACFDFLPTLAELDLEEWTVNGLFDH